MLFSLQADTVKRYRAVKTDDYGNKRISIKFPLRIESVEIRSTKGAVLAAEDVQRDSQACVYFKVSGAFISDTMVTLQSQVTFTIDFCN